MTPSPFKDKLAGADGLILRKNKKYKTGASRREESRKPSSGNRLGVAFDIGTTTIAAALADLSSNETLSALSAPNPQSQWGHDVISRIAAITKQPELLKAMNNAVITACNGLIRELAKGQSGRVAEISVAGNSVMEHIFLGVSPEPLGRVPYKPVFKETRRMSAKEADIDAGVEASLYAFPLVGAFIGGDAVAATLAIGLHRSKGVALLIDIGTNSEIILCVDGVIYASSAAAGPAFEAGGVKYGMTAQSGAISGVSVTGDAFSIDVIGSVRAKGICGSGLVKAVAEFVKAGLIESSGRIKDADEVHTNLSARIKRLQDGNSIVLFKGQGAEISLLQSDVRSLQTAKAAISAGISVLMKKAGIAATDVKKVYLAGAFGANLDPDALMAIGLLDRMWGSRVVFVGDAALEGAVSVLGSEDKKKEAQELAKSARYVPLSGSAHFEREFIRSMDFKP